MAINQDLETAFNAIKAAQPKREQLGKYYGGIHPLAFATEKFETTFGKRLRHMCDNLCATVVDATADRLEVINFASGDEQDDTSKAAWDLWQSETMELVSNETHVEALKTGEAFVIVWPASDSKPRFYLQDTEQCVMIEDEETGSVLFAAKQWRTRDDRVRLTLYYTDRIEKYITVKSGKNITLSAKSFVPLNIEGEQAVESNPYGVIPMFRFKTEPVLRNVLPIQDGLNKSVCDMMVAMEFQAFRQRWATGLEPPKDELTGVPRLPFKAGSDTLWFTNDKDVKFGQFDTADLGQFLAVSDSFRIEVARISGTPLHYFMLGTSDAMSGEALKTLESRFTKKVYRLGINFGTVWADAMRLALKIKGIEADNLTVQWESPEQRSDRERLECLGLKADILDVPVDVLREEYGYTPEDIQRFGEENELITDVEPIDAEPVATATTVA